MLDQSSVNPTIYFFHIDEKDCSTQYMVNKNDDQVLMDL